MRLSICCIVFITWLFCLSTPLFCQQNEINKYINKIKADPLDQSNYLKLAELYQENHKIDEVGNVFNNMLMYWPENSELYYRWALTLSLMNEHEMSLPKYLKSLQLNRENPKVMYNYAISLVRVKKSNVALRVMQKACELDPKNNKYLVFKNKILLSLSPNTSVDLPEDELYISQYNLTIQFYNANNLDNALISIDRALDISPNDNKALLIKSQILLDQKKYNQAITILLQITENNQQNYEAHFYLGEALFIMKNYDDSFQHFISSLPNFNSKKEAIKNCNTILNIMKIQNNSNYTMYSEQLAPFINKD